MQPPETTVDLEQLLVLRQKFGNDGCYTLGWHVWFSLSAWIFDFTDIRQETGAALFRNSHFADRAAMPGPTIRAVPASEPVLEAAPLLAASQTPPPQRRLPRSRRLLNSA